jgi:hypothetical protein
MENESEVIRQQMDETRAAMTDKIESLENQVVDTVQSASTAVSDTVGSVREIMHDTVESVRDTFDLPRQVDRRPWTMVAGASVLGYLGAYLLSGNKGAKARSNEISECVARAMKEHLALNGNGAPTGDNAVASAAPHQAIVAPSAAPDKPRWVSNLGNTFHAEISELESLAVGTLLGIVRDLVGDAVPEPMEHQVEKFVDGITVKLGGKPVDGRILPERPRTDGCSKYGHQEAGG